MANNKQRVNLVRHVRLGLYGKTAMNMIRALKRWIPSYGGSVRDSYSFHSVEIGRAPDGELTLDVYDDDRYTRPLQKTVFAGSDCGVYLKNDTAIRTWLAMMIKGAVKSRLASQYYCVRSNAIAACDDWNRMCGTSVSFDVNDAKQHDTAFSVADAYAAYEALKGRRPAASKYPDGVVARVVGEPFDPVRTELETFRAEEMTRIAAEYKEDKKAVDTWFMSEYGKLEAMRRDRMAAADAARDAKIAAMNAEVDSSISEAATSAA